MTPDRMEQAIIDMGNKVASMDTKLTTLCKMVKESSTGEGFARCAKHTEKLEKLEETNGAVIKTGIGVVAVVIIAELVRFLLTFNVI